MKPSLLPLGLSLILLSATASAAAPADEVSAQSLARVWVTNTLQAGACPQKLKPGLFDLPCTAGISGKTWGESCLTFKITEGFSSTYEELACVKSCGTGNATNAIPCASAPCYTAGPYFRTYASLDLQTQRSIAQKYTQLLRLVKAAGTPQYQTLGGDKERHQIKFAIVGQVIAGLMDDDTAIKTAPGTLLPFGACLLQQAAQREGLGTASLQLSAAYGKAPADYGLAPATTPGESLPEACRSPAPAGGAQGPLQLAGVSPMETTAGGMTIIYEAAFYDCGKTTPDFKRCLGAITPASPDLLAAAMVHELVHFSQKGFGHATPPSGLPDQSSDLKSRLYEIMAYGLSREDLFYRKALRADDVNVYALVGMKGQVKAFDCSWALAGPALQDEVAQWAWQASNWLRARLVRRTRPPEEGDVWNLLCGALRHKMPFAPCGAFDPR